jgi:hypothetical protein
MGICDYLDPTGAIEKTVLDVSGRFRSWCPWGRGGSNPFARSVLPAAAYGMFVLMWVTPNGR